MQDGLVIVEVPQAFKFLGLLLEDHGTALVEGGGHLQVVRGEEVGPHDCGIRGSNLLAGPASREPGFRRAQVKETLVLVVLLASAEGKAHQAGEGEGAGHDQIR